MLNALSELLAGFFLDWMVSSKRGFVLGLLLICLIVGGITLGLRAVFAEYL